MSVLVDLESSLVSWFVLAALRMPLCDGRPGAACPGKVNNSSVKLSQGDLMLCRDCELFRFPYLATASTVTTRSVAAARDASTTGDADQLPRADRPPAPTSHSEADQRASAAQPSPGKVTIELLNRKWWLTSCYFM